MNVRVAGWTVLVVGVVAFADDAERAKLMGVWESQGGADKDNKLIWLIESKGDAVHVTYFQGSQKVTEFECDTSGRDCATKVSGHPAKVSLYFNGPKLVELETKGSEVVKRRFGIVGSGEEMDVELIPIVSKDKAETAHFKRIREAPSSK